MNSSDLKKLLIVVSLSIVGTILLFLSPTPAPETLSRHAAVQSAYVPNSRDAAPSAPENSAEKNILTYGASVSPVLVDINDVPSQTPKVDELQLAYESGKVDIGVNESPVGDALFQALIAESAQQGTDPSVQNYQPPSNSLQTNSKEQATTGLISNASFKAIDYTQSRRGVPPDPDIMVGKDHVVVGVNTSFQIFDKAGNSLNGPTLYADFWNNHCGNGSSSLVLFDPFSQYDEENGRYILGIAAYDPNTNGGNNGWACIAVSQTDSAQGSWWLYSFDGNPGDGLDYFFDYPHIGVGQDAIYLTANMFGATFMRNHIFAFEKNAMYAGQSAQFIKIDVTDDHFSLQPAKLKGYSTNGWPTNTAEPHYFIDAQWGNNQKELTIWQLSDPWQNPMFTQAGIITVNNYSLPISQPQLDGSNVQGNDNRLLDVEYWAGKLWTTHIVGCNPGGGTVNCIRWYEIDVTNGIPSLLQQGTFSSNGEYRSFPDLGVNACGDLLAGYTKTSASMYPSIFISGREAGDLTGNLKSETLIHAGESAYTAYDNVPHRWGDYTGMALDPNGKTFWYVGQYSRQQDTARWSTWVSAHSWADCDPEDSLEPTPDPNPSATSTATATATVTETATPSREFSIYLPTIMK